MSHCLSIDRSRNMNALMTRINSTALLRVLGFRRELQHVALFVIGIAGPDRVSFIVDRNGMCALGGGNIAQQLRALLSLLDNGDCPLTRAVYPLIATIEGDLIDA